MGDTNVSGVGGGLSSGHHHQLHHHQLHHHQGSGPGGHHHSSHHVASVGPGHHHDAALSFGLGFFPDPSEISSKSLPPFSSFGETEGLGEGLSGINFNFFISCVVLITSFICDKSYSWKLENIALLTFSKWEIACLLR